MKYKTVKFYQSMYKEYKYMGWKKLNPSSLLGDVRSWLRSDKANHFVEAFGEQWSFERFNELRAMTYDYLLNPENYEG